MEIVPQENPETEVLVDGRVFIDQTDYAENPQVMSFHASLRSKLIGKCLLCDSEPMMCAVFVPGPAEPVFSRQGKRMTFTYGLCGGHMWPPDFEAIEEQVSRIMMFDALGEDDGCRVQ